MIAHESGVADVTDPLGGAYAIEAATDRVEERAEELFAEIDAMGKGSMLEGVLAGIDSGWFQRLIAEAAFEEQRRYESGDLVKVGVNAFVDPNDRPIETLVIGPKAEARQRDAVARTRAQRDRAAADGALARLGAAAATDENLIEPLISCPSAVHRGRSCRPSPRCSARTARPPTTERCLDVRSNEPVRCVQHLRASYCNCNHSRVRLYAGRGGRRAHP